MSHERLLPRSAPSAERMDAKSVTALLDRLGERSAECHSIMVVRNGRVVAEGWWAPYSRDRPQLLYSLTKSFVSVAVGFAVTDGLLGLDDRVVDVLDDHVPAGVSPRARQLSVHHLLSMTTGHRADTLAQAWALEPADLVKGFLRVPAQDPAGIRHAYNNPASFVLARMVERVTGRTLPDLLDARLFGPMGVTHAEWDRVASGAAFGFHGLHLTTEAVAAFGELLLRHGRWRGRQLVAGEWLELATRRQVETVQAGDGWRVRLDTGETVIDVDVGQSTWRESAPLGRPVVAMGAWQGTVFVADLYVITSPSRVRLAVAASRAAATWNIVPLTGPDLLRQLRSPLMTRPDVA
jgi:CubicO group peptidase (beta-lactamase class C family)